MLDQIEKRLLEILNGPNIAESLRAAEMLMQLEMNRTYAKSVGV